MHASLFPSYNVTDDVMKEVASFVRSRFENEVCKGAVLTKLAHYGLALHVNG